MNYENIDKLIKKFDNNICNSLTNIQIANELLKIINIPNDIYYKLKYKNITIKQKFKYDHENDEDLEFIIVKLFYDDEKHTIIKLFKYKIKGIINE